MSRPRRISPRRRAPALASFVAALVAGTAFAETPVPAPLPPAQDAQAPAPAPAPVAEAPKYEFLAHDLVRRPDGMIVRYYRVNYVSPAILKTELAIWKSPKGEITESGVSFIAAPVAVGQPKTAASPSVSNVLRIVETEEHWPVVERAIQMLDVPQGQVRVEAKVVELTWDDQLKLGISSKIDRPLGDTFLQSIDATFPNSLDAVNGLTARFKREHKYIVFDYAVQAAEQGARAEVTSQPDILASQGETAIIRAGDDEPFVVQQLSGTQVTATTQFKPTGVKLEVQPLFVGRDAVRVRIFAEASRVSDFRVTATSQNQQVVNAVISTRNADTVVTVPDGETLVIGGLQQKFTRSVKTGIPVLKDLPVLGYLFGSTTERETTTELFFWITLTIERPEEARVHLPDAERNR